MRPGRDKKIVQSFNFPNDLVKRRRVTAFEVDDDDSKLSSFAFATRLFQMFDDRPYLCLLYTSDAADE